MDIDIVKHDLLWVRKAYLMAIIWGQLHGAPVGCLTKWHHPATLSDKARLWYLHIHTFIKYTLHSICVSQNSILLQYAMIGDDLQFGNDP